MYKILNLLLQIFYVVGQIFIVVNGQKLKNNLTIWWYYLYQTLVIHPILNFKIFYEHTSIQNTEFLLLFVDM